MEAPPQTVIAVIARSSKHTEVYLFLGWIVKINLLLASAKKKHAAVIHGGITNPVEQINHFLSF